jgi:hypothetical protein
MHRSPDQRFYASSYGRFNTADPHRASARLTDPSGSWNRYAYTRGDPVNRADPRGLDDCDADICVDVWGWSWGGPFEGMSPAQEEYCLAQMEQCLGQAAQAQGGGGGLLMIANFTTAGAQAQAVQNSLRWIEAQIGSFPICDNWLGGNDNVTNIINTLLGQTATVTTDSVGVGNFNNPAVNAVYGTAGTNLPTNGTALLTINVNGAYFNKNAAVGPGAVGINAGSSQAQLFILLHELAHATDAAGFQENDIGQAIQAQNNQLLMQNCAGFIKSVSN